MILRRWWLSALLVAALALTGAAQEADSPPGADRSPGDGVFAPRPPEPAPPKELRGRAIVPNPEPFTLNSYNVLQAVALIRRVGFLQVWEGEGFPETIAVDSVRSLPVGTEPDTTPARRSRYTILVNGEPLSWDHSFIEYDGRMMNLRLLYSYRNQHPPEDLRHFIPLDIPHQ